MSSHKISSQSTVSGIITKWKQLGTTATQSQSGVPRKMTERGQWMLRRIVRKDRQVSAESIATDLQTSCGLQISSRTMCRELHGIGFHGRAVATWLCTSAQSKVHKDMDERVWCGWTWLACTESWPRAETESQAFPSNISVWPHKCTSGRIVKNSHKHS